ncbi:MAG TPA: MOSC domain-containing protein [Streptosporangiaceae bacterium]|jgi:MOSC domain-containing protein YiiM
MGRVISVNVGHIFDADWAGRVKRTAIDKRPVAGRVPVHALGVGDDEQADKDNHGGHDQAVYAYAREDLDWWIDQLQRELPPGTFGENLTLSGIDVNGALLGERWRVGGALLEVTAPRVPCSVFRNWLDIPGWVKWFTEVERTGAYLRVLEEGEVAAGDPATVEHRPADSVTIVESFRAFHGDRALMRRILALPGHAADWDEIAERVLRDSA